MPQILSYSTHDVNSAWDPVKPHPATHTTPSTAPPTHVTLPPTSASHVDYMTSSPTSLSQATKPEASPCSNVVPEQRCEPGYGEACMEVYYVEHGRVYLLPHSALSTALVGAEAVYMPSCTEQAFTPCNAAATCQHVLTDASWEALLQAPGVRWRNEPYRGCTVLSDCCDIGTSYVMTLPHYLAPTTVIPNTVTAAFVAEPVHATPRGQRTTAPTSVQPIMHESPSEHVPIRPGAGASCPSARRVPGDCRCISYCLPAPTTAASSPHPVTTSTVATSVRSGGGSSLDETRLTCSIASGASFDTSTHSAVDGMRLSSTVCSGSSATATAAPVETTRSAAKASAARRAGMRGKHAECQAPPLRLPPSTVARSTEVMATLQQLWHDAACEPLFQDIFTLREVLHGTRCNWSPGVGRRLGSGPRATFRVDCAGLHGMPLLPTTTTPHTDATPVEHSAAAQEGPAPDASHQSWTYLYVLQHRHRTSICVSCQRFDKGVLVVVDGDMGVEMGVVREAVTRSSYESMSAAERVLLRLPKPASCDFNDCASTSSTQASPLPSSPHARAYRAANAAETELYHHTLPQLAEHTLRYLHALQNERDFITCRIELMHFVGCEFQADLQKLYVYYHSPRPVRFLELATRLNHVFRCRIWIHEVAAARVGQQAK